MVNLEAEKAELAPSPVPITARSTFPDLPPRRPSFGSPPSCSSSLCFPVNDFCDPILIPRGTDRETLPSVFSGRYPLSMAILIYFLDR